MAKKMIFVDQVAQYPSRFIITDNGDGTRNITPSYGTISIEGTPISADNLNAVADEVIYKLKDTATVANTYVANIDGLLGYFDSLTVMFKPNNSNTDTSTLNLTGLGAIAIKKVDDTGSLVGLSQNDLIKGKYYTMTYDSTDAQNPCFIMNNPSAELASIVTAVNSLEDRLNTDEETINSLKTETVKFTVLQGTANTYAATISTVSTLTSGLEINFVPNVSNTGASTLNINELGAKNITYNGSAIVSGMLVQNKLYKVLYNGVSFELQPSSNFTPVSNGVMQTNLNADMIDGKNASDFAQPSQNNAFAGEQKFYVSSYSDPLPGITCSAKFSGNVAVDGGNLFVNKMPVNNYAVTTNSDNAYSATIGGLSSLTDGLQVRIKFNSASAGATTLNINSLGAKSIVDYFGNAVTNIRQNLIANLCYESTNGNFILQGKGGGGNATSADLLTGKTATVDGGQITGAMVNYSAQHVQASQATNSTYDGNTVATLLAPGGYYGNTWVYSNEPDLSSDNIKAGKSILGVSGKSSVVDTADATALTADKILNGYSAYANGSKVNGNATIESLGGKKFKSDTITFDSQGNISYTCGFKPSIVILQGEVMECFYLSFISSNYTQGGFIEINPSYPQYPKYRAITITDSGFSTTIPDLVNQSIIVMAYE